MKKCTSCGAALADAARLCKECGTVQPMSASQQADRFAIPYLSASLEEKNISRGQSAVSSAAKAKSAEKISDTLTDASLDPRERAFAKRDKRNRMLRIAAGVLACCLVITGILYFFLRTTGYEKSLDNYITGRLSDSAVKYTAIVPETYLIQAEGMYHMSRPEIRSTINGYFAYVKNQMENNYGTNLSLSYDIIGEKISQDADDIEELQAKISDQYQVRLDITEIASITIRLTTSGSQSTNTESSTLTFYQSDGSWYSLEAMDSFAFACENAGYNLW